MIKVLPFSKIEATGNDFIMITVPQAEPLLQRSEWIARLCDRHLGVGADGVIYLRRVGQELHMNYYNSDGNEASMCGNGLRAATILAVQEGMAEPKQSFFIHAPDGRHEVVALDHQTARVELLINNEGKKGIPKIAYLPDHFKVLGYINTGVPHLVIQVNRELTDLQVSEWGRRLRFDPLFAPEGVNVNFLRRVSGNEIEVRTYERGVEEETLSCGTGVTACAMLYRGAGFDHSRQLSIFTRGGVLKVLREDGRVFLEGAAHKIFEGHVSIVRD